MKGQDDTRRLRAAAITDRDVDRLLDKLDSQQPTEGNSRREHKRFPYRIQSLSVRVKQPGESSASPYVVQSRNLSAGGLSFLHGGFVHQGSKVVVQFITTQGAWLDVVAQVVNCRYLELGMHEVAIQFDKPVPPADFCTAALTFDFLLVDDDEAIARVAMHHLAMLNVEVEWIENGQLAVERCSSQIFDCVLMDLEMPVLDGLAATRKLRDNGYTGRIIAMTGMARPADRERCLKAGCNHYFAKPVSPEIFGEMLEMIQRQPVVSLYQNDPAMRPLVLRFAESIPSEIRKIEEAAAAKDFEQLEILARVFKSTAGSYGYETIQDAAMAVENAVQDEESRGVVLAALGALINQCMEVAMPTGDETDDDGTRFSSGAAA